MSGAGERGFLDHMADLVDLGKKVVSGETTAEELFNDAAGDNKPADPSAIVTEGVSVPDTEPAPALKLVPPPAPSAKPEAP